MKPCRIGTLPAPPAESRRPAVCAESSASVPLSARGRAHPDEVQVVRVVGERIQPLRAALRDVVLVRLRRLDVRPRSRRRGARRAGRCARACGRCGRRRASAAAGDRLRLRPAPACRSTPTGESTGAARRDGSRVLASTCSSDACTSRRLRVGRRRRASSSSTAADPSAPRRSSVRASRSSGTRAPARPSRRRRRGRPLRDPRRLPV